jgi:hypothetical protein
MEVTRSKLGWIPKPRRVDSNAESWCTHARRRLSSDREQVLEQKAPTRWGVRRGDDVRYDESAVTARHFEARRGEAEEEGTRDRRHG